MTSYLANVAIRSIVPNPSNVRTDTIRALDLIASMQALKAQGKSPLLCPLTVLKQEDSPDYLLVAGHRRLHALKEIGETLVDVLVYGNAADFSNAEIAELATMENTTRVDLGPVDEFMAFQAMMRDGYGIDEIAKAFSADPLHIRQRLALASLVPDVLKALRKGDIDLDTAKVLTMATPAQQRDIAKEAKRTGWPGHWQIKRKLLNDPIDASVAIFDIAQSGLTPVTDLFGGRSYFADTEAFMKHQLAAVAAKVEAYKAAGWADVVLIGEDEQMPRWWWHKRELQRKMTNEAKARIKALSEEQNAIPDADDGQTDEQAARFDAIAEEIADIDMDPASFQPVSERSRKKWQVYIRVERSGKVEIYEGVLPPETKAEQKQAAAANEGGEAQPVAAAPQPGISKSYRGALYQLKPYRLSNIFDAQPDFADALLCIVLVRSLSDTYVRFDLPHSIGHEGLQQLTQTMLRFDLQQDFIEQLAQIAIKGGDEALFQHFLANPDQRQTVKNLYALAALVPAFASAESGTTRRLADYIGTQWVPCADMWEPTEEFCKALSKQRAAEMLVKVAPDRFNLSAALSMKKGELAAALHAVWKDQPGIKPDELQFNPPGTWRDFLDDAEENDGEDEDAYAGEEFQDEEAAE